MPWPRPSRASCWPGWSTPRRPAGTRRSRSPAAAIADALHRELAQLSPDSEVDWSRVVVWWGDERFVGPGSPDRNAGQARAAFLDAVGATRVHEMPSTEDAGDARQGAAAYADELREHGAGEFDVVMLGIGPDGHVASLFPGQPALDVDDRDRRRRHRLAQAAAGADQPDLRRAPTGPGRCGSSSAARTRRAAVARALGGADLHDIPAAGVTGREETIWFLDRASASEL